MELISIIVPIYNVEKYLRKCIDSILSQTYTNLEIILIDDGSTDGCGKICEEYAKKDNRILSIHKENGGLPDARNAGLKVFKGDYVVFIDSDDFIEPQAIELLYKLYKENNVSCSMFLTRIVYEWSNLDTKLLDLSEVKTLVLTQDETMRGLFSLTSYTNYLFQVATNKLYPRKLIKNTFFKISANEDTEFNSRIFLKTDKVAFGLVPMYNWFQRQGSITHEPVNQRKINVIPSYYRIFNTFSGHKTYQAYCLDYLYKVMLNIRHYAKGTSYESSVKKVCKHYKKLTLRHLISNKTLPLHRKLVLLFLYYCPLAYDAFMWICEIRAKRKKR